MQRRPSDEDLRDYEAMAALDDMRRDEKRRRREQDHPDPWADWDGGQNWDDPCDY